MEITDEFEKQCIVKDSRDIRLDELTKAYNSLQWAAGGEINRAKANTNYWYEKVSEKMNEIIKLGKLLDLHRRFHSKVGCPGGDECYVCKEDK